MAKFIFTTRLWWPALFRALLLCTLAYLVAFDSNFDGLVAKMIQSDTAKWTRMEWLAVLYPMFGKPFLAAFIALKGFMDDTWGKTRATGETMFLTKGDVK